MGRYQAFKSWWYGNETTETETASTDAMAAPSRMSAGRSVSVEEAVSLPMVYRAIQIHAIAAKQLSIDTYRHGEIIADNPLIRRPDPSMTRSKWVERVVVALATTGNCYLELIGDVVNPLALRVLNPLDVRIQVDRNETLTGYAYRGRTFRPAQIRHLTLLSVEGMRYGLGPIQAAQSDLRGALDTRDYAANWLDAGGVPNGVLKTEQVLNPDQAKQAKKTWNESTGARKGVAVLGQGLDYKPVFLTPKDVQFIESQQFNVVTIARMFGTPASLMLAAIEGNSQSYANVEQDWLAYVRFTLMGYLTEIEDVLSDLLPGAQQARFNTETLLRADTTSRYQSFKTAIEAGFLTVDEVRQIEHRSPLKQETPENVA